MQFDYSSFIQGKTSHVVFLWKYLSIIYIYFCKSHQVRSAQLVRKENMCRRDQVCSIIVGSCLGEEKRCFLKMIT